MEGHAMFIGLQNLKVRRLLPSFSPFFLFRDIVAKRSDENAQIESRFNSNITVPMARNFAQYFLLHCKGRLKSQYGLIFCTVFFVEIFQLNRIGK